MKSQIKNTAEEYGYSVMDITDESTVFYNGDYKLMIDISDKLEKGSIAYVSMTALLEGSESPENAVDSLETLITRRHRLEQRGIHGKFEICEQAMFGYISGAEIVYELPVAGIDELKNVFENIKEVCSDNYMHKVGKIFSLSSHEEYKAVGDFSRYNIIVIERYEKLVKLLENSGWSVEKGRIPTKYRIFNKDGMIAGKIHFNTIYSFDSEFEKEIKNFRIK